jgi:hypothetical protein
MTSKTHVCKSFFGCRFTPALLSEQHVALTNITMEYLALFPEETGNCLRDERLFKERRKYVTLKQIVYGDQSLQRCLCIHEGRVHVVLQNEQSVAYLLLAAVASPPP